jgi:hypothetical protein
MFPEITGFGGKAWGLAGVTAPGLVGTAWLVRQPASATDVTLSVARLLMASTSPASGPGHWMVWVMQLNVPAQWGPGRIQQTLRAAPATIIQQPELAAVELESHAPQTRAILTEVIEQLADLAVRDYFPLRAASGPQLWDHLSRLLTARGIILNTESLQ